jgi:lysophospholipase L1-like esterase
LSSVAVIGSSTTDGDGSTQDHNGRMPDVLASRLQKAGGASARIGVLNAGIIGNRLLKDSPAESSFGAGLGEAVLARLDRDALDQPGLQFMIVAIGVNDIAFPGAFTHADEAVSAQSLIQGYREIISRAHARGIKVLMTTIPPFGNAIFPSDHTLVLHTPEKEAVRRAVNDWIRTTKEGRKKRTASRTSMRSCATRRIRTDCRRASTAAITCMPTMPAMRRAQRLFR